MTITLVIDKERAEQINKSESIHYTTELFEPEQKLSDSHIGIKFTFPDFYSTDMVSLLIFHAGFNVGLDKGCEIWRPDRFKNISVDGRNEN
jgi:hypothetical protein